EVEHLEQMRRIGCEVLDTTCPWVEKPHRRVLKYIEDGFTTLIHGLLGHAETRATCSLVDSKGGKWLVLLGLDECDFLCSFLGGYDSSNTANLLRAARARHGVFHVQEPASISADVIRHRDPSSGAEVETRDWLPSGTIRVGVTAGASTPDTELAEVIRRICVA